MRLRASGPEYVPLRVFRDDDLLDPGSDPLIALLGALSALRPGERVVARLLLRSLGPDWSQAHQRKAHEPAVRERNDSYQISESRRHRVEIAGMAALGVGGLAFFKGYQWWQAGEEWKAAALGAGIALGLGVAGWAWARWQRSRNRVHDPLLIKEKVSRIAFEAELQVTAVLPEGDRRQRAQELLGQVAAAYRHYDHPAGARFLVGKVGEGLPDPHALAPPSPGLFGARSVIGVREAACLWHPPGARDETPLVARSGARVLMPSAREVRGGALVGHTTTGTPREIRFSDDLARRHHLYTARTRMGKSTLMQHLVVHKMEEKAAGRDGDADHRDRPPRRPGRRASSGTCPESLIGQVRLVDLADPRGAPGINLLDTRVFSDRDRTADSVVRVARGLWEQWGPRMQSILEQTVKTLHEHNAHPATARGRAAHHPRRAAACSATSASAWGCSGASPTPTCWSGGRATSGAGAASTPPRRSRPCRRGSPTTPRRGGRAPSSASAAPPSTAAHHPRRRRAARLHGAGHGRQGRRRPRRVVRPQPRRRRHPRAGRAAPGPAARRARGRGRDAVDAGRRLRIDAE